MHRAGSTDHLLPRIHLHSTISSRPWQQRRMDVRGPGDGRSEASGRGDVERASSVSGPMRSRTGNAGRSEHRLAQLYLSCEQGPQAGRHGSRRKGSRDRYKVPGAVEPVMTGAIMRKPRASRRTRGAMHVPYVRVRRRRQTGWKPVPRADNREAMPPYDIASGTLPEYVFDHVRRSGAVPAGIKSPC